LKPRGIGAFRLYGFVSVCRRWRWKRHSGALPFAPASAAKAPPACDFALYCERNLVERFVNQIKHFRAVATCHDTLARNFLAGVQLAAVTILLN
jgi:transposase